MIKLVGNVLLCFTLPGVGSLSDYSYIIQSSSILTVVYAVDDVVFSPYSQSYCQ